MKISKLKIILSYVKLFFYLIVLAVIFIGVTLWYLK